MDKFLSSDIGGIVMAVIAFYVAWWLYKNVFSSSGSSVNSKQYPYEYMGKRFKTKREMEQYKDVYREAVRRNDPRFR